MFINMFFSCFFFFEKHVFFLLVVTNMYYWKLICLCLYIKIKLYIRLFPFIHELLIKRAFNEQCGRGQSRNIQHKFKDDAK